MLVFTMWSEWSWWSIDPCSKGWNCPPLRAWNWILLIFTEPSFAKNLLKIYFYLQINSNFTLGIEGVKTEKCKLDKITKYFSLRLCSPLWETSQAWDFTTNFSKHNSKSSSNMCVDTTIHRVELGCQRRGFIPNVLRRLWDRWDIRTRSVGQQLAGTGTRESTEQILTLSFKHNLLDWD